MSREVHLYALSRIVAEPVRVFHVGEDLVEVYTRLGKLLEVVYFERNGLLDRVRLRLREYPDAVQRFVSFDAVPRILQAIPAATGGLEGEARVALERAGFSRKQIDALRAVFVVEEVRIDENPTFPYLSAWLQRERGRVTAFDVRDRLQALNDAGVPPLHDGALRYELTDTTTLDPVRKLAAHARAMRVPLDVRFDVQPRDLGWAAMMDELQAIEGVRVLLSVSHSYWDRALATGAPLLWRDVRLALRDARPDPNDERDWEALVIEGADVGALQPTTWAGAAGIFRGLLWRDVQHYLAANAELMDDVRRRMPAQEVVWAVLDPVGLALLDADAVFGASPELSDWYDDVRSRKPADAFASARAWLSAQRGAWQAPKSGTDWAGVAEIGFWARRWNLESPSFDTAHHADAPLATIVDAVFATRDETLRAHAVERFRREMLTPAIDDDGETVTARWIAPLEDDINLSRETIRRLDLLRRLFPEGKAFGAHVYGNVSAETRHVPAEQFPVPWLLRVHLMFSRPELTWVEYARSVASLRTRIAALAAKITSALTTWFRRDKPFTIFEAGVDAEEWDAISAQLANLPKLPRNAVDTWGIEVEGPVRAWSAGTAHAHADYESALAAYAAAVREFLAASWRFFVANPQIGRGTAEGRERVEKWLGEENITRELPTQRLAEAVKTLDKMQREFGLRFSDHFEDDSLRTLVREERERLWDLWAVWYDFAFYPRRKLANAVRDSKGAIEARIDERRRSLRRRFRELTMSKAEIHSEDRGLWITLDVEYGAVAINAFAEALVHVIDVLRPPIEPHAFDRYVLDLVWNRVHLVPLVRGKSLDRKYWSLEITTMPRPDEDVREHASKFVPRRIDAETWATLGLETWPSNVSPAGRQFMPRAMAFREALDHLVSLRDIPDADSAVLIAHWSEVAAVAMKHADALHDVLAQIPPALFSDREEGAAPLQDFVRGIRGLLANAEPLAFDLVAEVRTNVVDTLIPAASAIGDVWIDAEIPRDE